MKKIKTLFPKNPNNLRLVINDDPIIDLESEDTEFYIKMDGQACAIINGQLYTRYDAKLFKKKRGKIVKKFTIDKIKEKLPDGAIACQEPDEKSGHYPHWIPIDKNNKTHQYIIEGFENSLKIFGKMEDGTYEIVGPKFTNNKHKLEKHYLLPHKHRFINVTDKIDKQKMIENPYEYFKEFLNNLQYEGLVIYQNGEPVAKIRRSDYGIDIDEYENMLERI